MQMWLLFHILSDVTKYMSALIGNNSIKLYNIQIDDKPVFYNFIYLHAWVLTWSQ